jgi:hypothetical protein
MKYMEECLSQRLLGKWQGTVHEEMGGYQQSLEFSENGQVATCIASLPAKCGTYEIKRDPKVQFPILEIKFPQISNFVVPYILKHEVSNQHQLHLCCPFLDDKIPRAFEGPGYIVMTRVTSTDDPQGLVSGSVHERTRLYLKEAVELLLRLDVIASSFDSELTANKAAIALMGALTKLEALAHKYGVDVLENIDTTNDAEIKKLVNLMRRLCKEKGITNHPQQKADNETANSTLSEETESGGSVAASPEIVAAIVEDAAGSRLTGWSILVLSVAVAVVMWSSLRKKSI